MKVIDKRLLDEVSAKTKVFPRLRMNSFISCWRISATG